MNIVQNINSVIHGTQYTLTELERICDFPKSSIRKWSENIPNINKVAKVANVLNVSLDYLYYGEEKNTAPELTKEEQQCLDKFNVLTEMDKGKILERMDVMYEAYDFKEKGERSG